MRLTKRQKVCIAILFIVLGVLIVDRIFLGQGKVPAEASAHSNQAPSKPISGAANALETVTQSVTMKLVHALETLWSEKNLDQSQSRDAFTLPESWLNEAYPENRLRYEQVATTRFARNHQLRAVLLQGQTWSVMVDDYLLVVGQELDGFKLVAIDEGSATFEAGSKRVVLRLRNDR